MAHRLRLVAFVVFCFPAACGRNDIPRPPPPGPLPGTGGEAGGTGGTPPGAGGTGGLTTVGGAAASADAAVPDAAAQDASAQPVDAAMVAEGPAAAGGMYKVEGVATWRGNATAAYSIIHDDVCDSSANGVFSRADPELTRRGLHAGFGVIAGTCDSDNRWGAVKTVVSHGHDLFSHSWTHSCLGTPAECDGQKATSNLAQEIDRATKAILDNTGVTAQYYIFPFDICGAAAVAHLKQAGYLGARCGEHGVNAPDFSLADNFANRYDVWGPNFSLYFDQGPCKGVAKEDQDVQPNRLPAACRAYVLSQYVEDTIAAKGWGIKEMHGFDEDIPGGAFQALPPADYTAHLDFLKTKIEAGALWVEGPTPVLRYRWARSACPAPTIAGDTLKFAAPPAECTKYATTLTYLVSTTAGDPGGLQVAQGEKMAAARKLGTGRFAIDADPTKGDVTLTAR
jgi:hypothetical protein